MDPVEEWKDGPLLRKSSFTAKQLVYLSPKNLNIQSRKLYIGDFPEEWTQSNVDKWFEDAASRSRQISASDDRSGSKKQTDVYNFTQLQFATAVAADADNEVYEWTTRRRRIANAMRIRRNKLRHEHLYQAALVAENDAGADTQMKQEKPEFEKKEEQEEEQQEEEPEAEDSDGASSNDTLYHDCKTSIDDDERTDVEEHYDERPSETPHVLQLSGKNRKHLIEEPVSDSSAAGRASGEPSDHLRLNLSNDRKGIIATTQAHISRHKNKSVKIYLGKFLVQERRSRSARPVVSEVEAPLETRLETRWRECGIVVRYAKNSRKALALYFYECIDQKKLYRKSKRRWSRSLLFKIVLDPHFEVATYSPLDLTLALWRPRLPGEKHHHHYENLSRSWASKHDLGLSRTDDTVDQHTRIILMHSQSVAAIMNLSYLLTSITKGAPWLRECIHMKINVPCVSATIRVESKATIEGALEELRSSQASDNELISYSEVLKPVVNGSAMLSSLANSVYKLVEQLPRRLHVGSEDRNEKYTFAWLIPGLEHRPLWISSSSSRFFPSLWLYWHMMPKSTLALLQPKARCSEVSEVEEPPAVEGFCSYLAISKSSSSGSAVPSPGPRRPQYIVTADQYLLYMPLHVVEPPSLAFSQKTAEKLVAPYVLDETSENIAWIKESKSLRDIDYHDTIATMEFERKTSLLKKARGLLNLLHSDSFETNEKGELTIKGAGHTLIMSYPSVEMAEIWAKRLKDISDYWKRLHEIHQIRKVLKTFTDLSITSFLHDRNVIYSGPLFMKQHRFSSFKSFRVILTTDSLEIFRINQTKRPPTHLAKNIPSAAFLHRHFMTLNLDNTYVYTGQVAMHTLLDDDAYMDPENPGMRALPRTYDNGWTSQDTELDRCFVLWCPKKSFLDPLRSSKKNSFIAFLAQEKDERDRWATAVRHVQSRLSTKRDLRESDVPLEPGSDEDESDND